jgi:hypothetical protein
MPSTTASHNPKEWWTVAECVVWICTRRLDRVAALRDMNAEDAIGHAIMRYVAGWRVTSRRPPSGPGSVARRGSTGQSGIEQGGELAAGARRDSLDAAILPVGGPRDELEDSSSATPTNAAPSYDIEPVHSGETVIVTGAQALEDLVDMARSGRIKMMGRKVGGIAFEQIQPIDLVDLNFRIVLGQTAEPVGLWMHGLDVSAMPPRGCNGGMASTEHQDGCRSLGDFLPSTSDHARRSPTDQRGGARSLSGRGAGSISSGL